MRLAADPIVIEHGGIAVLLRPSLRAAFRLNARHGVGRLVQGVEENNFTVLYDILEEGGGADAVHLAEHKARGRLEDLFVDWRPAIFDFLKACFGADDKAEHPAESSAKAGKPFDMEAALTSFFEIGTGWLGWTPKEVWQSTPAEIMAAQRGLVAKLKAIYGSAEKESTDPREEVPIEQVRDGLAKLRALSGKLA